MIYFHQNLRFLRKGKKLSQAALAELLELSRSNIAAYEAGNSEPSLRKLLKISDFFKVPMRDFINEDLASEAYIDAQKINNKVSNLELNTLNDFVSKTTETKEIIAGFKQFFKFRMKQKPNPSRELALMANDYENLLEVTEDLLVTNNKIIEAISIEPI